MPTEVSPRLGQIAFYSLLVVVRKESVSADADLKKEIHQMVDILNKMGIEPQVTKKEVAELFYQLLKHTANELQEKARKEMED